MRNMKCIYSIGNDTSFLLKVVTSKERKEIVDNSMVNLMEICCEDGRWMELAQDRVQW
jgi:hypothetical protein